MDVSLLSPIAEKGSAHQIDNLIHPGGQGCVQEDSCGTVPAVIDALLRCGLFLSFDHDKASMTPKTGAGK